MYGLESPAGALTSRYYLKYMLSRLLCALAAASALSAADDLDCPDEEHHPGVLHPGAERGRPRLLRTGLLSGAIPGLLRKLDPHSVFFDPGQFEQLKKMEASTQKGFGSVVSLLPGRVIVLQTLPGTPSAKAGLLPGDEILAVNGYIIGQLDTEQITQLLTQSRQQQAQLDVRRPAIPPRICTSR